MNANRSVAAIAATRFARSGGARPRLARRAGFTLVELLVVISIIALLIALSAAAAVRVIGAQRVSRTEDELRLVDKTLRNQWDKVVTEASKEQPSDAVADLASGDPFLARVLWIKFRLTEAFPQTYAEVNNCFSATPAVLNNTIYGIDTRPGGTGLPWIPPEKRKYMAGYYRAVAGKTGGTPQQQSSALLYLALSVNRGGVKLDDSKLPGFIADTDGDGLNEIVDSWGNALMFYRFPIGNAELAAKKPASGAKARFGDPLDADGRCQQLVGGSAWCFQANATLFSTLCNHPFPTTAPQPYWVPYIASAGTDGQLNTSDDVLSFRVISFGARGD